MELTIVCVIIHFQIGQTRLSRIQFVQIFVPKEVNFLKVEVNVCVHLLIQQIAARQSDRVFGNRTQRVRIKNASHIVFDLHFTVFIQLVHGLRYLNVVPFQYRISFHFSHHKFVDFCANHFYVLGER